MEAGSTWLIMEITELKARMQQLIARQKSLTTADEMLVAILEGTVT